VHHGNWVAHVRQGSFSEVGRNHRHVCLNLKSGLIADIADVGSGPTTDIGRTNFCPQGEATSISAEPIAALAGRLLLTAFDGVHGASMISLS
jgi:hypothetical protein